MNTAETIQQVINTLDKITVSGYDNMNKMLGCMQALNRIKTELATEATEKGGSSNGD